MATIVHFRKNCSGCNSCVEQAPQRWEIAAKDGKSVLKGGEEKKGVFVCPIHQTELEENERAARDCPMRIIKVFK